MRRPHHRNVPFRPPRQAHEEKSGTMRACCRFLLRYLRPYRWTLIGNACIWILAGSSVYLMTFLVKVVVDDVLQVKSGAHENAGQAAAPGRRADPASFYREAGIRTGEAMPTHRSVAEPGGVRVTRDAVPRGPGQFQQWEAARFEKRHRPVGAAAVLGLIFLAYLGAVVGVNLLQRVQERRTIAVNRDFLAKLRADLHAKILRLSVSFHKSYTVGRLMARILDDISVLQGELMPVLFGLVNHGFTVLLGLLLLLAVDGRLALIAYVVLPVYALLHRKIQPEVRALSREVRHTNACMWGFVVQRLNSVKAVQAYVQEGREGLNFHRLAACFVRDAVQQRRYSALLHAASIVVGGVGRAAIFLYGAHLVLGGSMTLGKMLFACGTANSLFWPVIALSNMGVSVTRMFIVVQRMTDIMDSPEEIRDRDDAVEMPAPLTRGITLRDVSFGYKGGTGSVFRGLNLDIPVGTRLCVMGSSGSGKTTLAALLTRLYEPESGEILFDDVPLNRIRLASLRLRVAVVPQEAQIFSGTIARNICYGHPRARPRQIIAAAKAAEIHDFIMGLSVRYETIVGEHGVSLSGGQRQRISLARALLVSPDILILDDCTSALDANTERQIQETLARILVGRTAIIVSHRVSMAERCDRICVLGHGVVAEAGTHPELLARGGFYARLFERQTR
ncbi:MAG: ABC transporter ATP-binding protein [Kiritimatiellae bacterium]|nr:ABC transporter ATP-binding protein [Kiritimatiellia bacterium]